MAAVNRNGSQGAFLPRVPDRAEGSTSTSVPHSSGPPRIKNACDDNPELDERALKSGGKKKLLEPQAVRLCARRYGA